MFIYTITWVSMICLSKLKIDNKNTLLYIFLIIFLTMFSGLRWEVGCDWGNYLIHYYIVSTQNFTIWDMQKEHGWWFLADTIEDLGLPYVTLNLIVAIIFFACIHLFARRQNDPVAFIIVLFPMLILGMVMAAVRQAIAIGFISLAFLAFIDRSPIKMTMWILIASMFHVSSLIFAPLIPISWGVRNKYRMMISSLISIPIFIIIINSENSSHASAIYTESEIVARGALIRIGCLLSTAVIFWFFMRSDWKRKYPEDYPLAVILSFSTIGLLILSGPSSVIADRLSYYFVPLQAMIVARAPHLLKIQNAQYILAAQWLVLTVALIGWMLVSNHFAWCYVPYQNVIFGVR